MKASLYYCYNWNLAGISISAKKEGGKEGQREGGKGKKQRQKTEGEENEENIKRIRKMKKRKRRKKKRKGKDRMEEKGKEKAWQCSKSLKKLWLLATSGNTID